MKIIGSTSNWYQVEAPDGKTGYMYASYISFSGGGTGTAYVTSSNGYGVRMRSGPGTGYSIIGVYSVGTAGDRAAKRHHLEQSPDRQPRRLYHEPVPDPPAAAVAAPATARRYGGSNGYGVRLRSGPGTSYSVIGIYSVGTSVTVLTHRHHVGLHFCRKPPRLYDEQLPDPHRAPPSSQSFSFDKTSATATVTSAGASLDVTPTILGTNLTSPYFTLAVSSNASSYVTATRNSSTGNILIDISSTIPDNTCVYRNRHHGQ